ncbi:TraB/GumN family protein [Aureispira anguillae]|uniref:TraB/GumN family protein n=1 Tax=Aureispira anguillae TaxID=2864201 RepID=A0A915YFE4_9BACT|nr:TraB/GumN family protein [Aureispira anguillae]BDS12140.1 TraB/GumN family protein [Aureispira anguillae]
MRTTKTNLFLFLLLFPWVLFAQDSVQYNLLWKIEGNGLKNPSYLFGTMHVNDARAFNFSDSVMLALESCESFALEVHPDSMMQTMFQKLFNAKKNNNLMQVLSDEEYLQLKEKFEKNSQLDLDQINLDNPSILSTIIEADEARLDDKETFVDAYLFGIARTLNKPVYGLESIHGHLTSFSDYSPEQQRAFLLNLIQEDYQKDYKEMLNQFVEVYKRGNIAEIGRMANIFTQTDSALIKRNVVMVDNMITIMQQRSLFAAVGTAHLPGNNGIIDLLVKKGYLVRPVTANFTGVAAHYTIDHDKMNWHTHIDSSLGFAMDLPGQPTPITIYKDMNTLIYVDLTNEVFFASYSIDLRQGSPQNKKQLIEATLNNYTSKLNSTILERKTSIINGTERTNVIVQQDSSTYFRLQFIYQNDILYYFMIGNTLEQIRAVYAERYYQSLRFFAPSPLKTQPWVVTKPNLGAFSVKFPTASSYVNQKIPSGINGYPYAYHNYSANNYSEMKSYLVRYYDQPTGYVRSGNKNSSFRYIANNFEQQGTKIIKTDTIQLDSIQGRSYDLLVDKQYYVRCKVYIRGFRTYYLFHQNLNAGDSILIEDDFLKSFQFESYPNPDFAAFVAEDSSFSIDVLSRPRIRKDTFNSYYIDQVRYHTVNPNSGMLYIFETSLMNPYFKIAALDSFYQQFLTHNLSYGDSLISKKKVTIGNIGGQEIVYREYGKDRMIRKRFWLDNQRFYVAKAFIDDDAIYSSYTNHFFDSFRSKNTLPTFDFLASKSSQLLKDLSTTDSIVQLQAYRVLEYYRFDASDAPAILQVAQQHYTNPNLIKGTIVHLIHHLKEIADSSYTTDLVHLYQAPTSTPAIKIALLQAILSIDSLRGFSIYLELLQNSPIAENSSNHLYPVFNALNNIPNQAIQHYQHLLALAKNQDYRPYILSLSISLAENNAHFAQYLEKYIPIWLPYFNVDLEYYDRTLTRHSFTDNFILSRYFHLFSVITNKNIIDSLTQDVLNSAHSSSVYVQTIVARLRVGLAPYIATPKLRQLIHNHKFRPYLLGVLFRYGQRSLIPQQYRYAPKVAKTMFYDYIRDEDSIDFVKELGKVKRGKSNYYIYEYRFLDESTSYIGVAGPFYKGKAIQQYDYRGLTYSKDDPLTNNWQQQAIELIEILERLHN